MEENPAPRKLAAILIADAVGYSRHIGENEEGALRALKARRELIEQSVIQHSGRVFGGAGDSVVAEFASAVLALKAAVEAQSTIASLNQAAPEADRMLFRMGINVGDVIVEGQNLYGDGVNIAERLQLLAEPGGICIAGSVHEQVRDKLRLAYGDLGKQQLKNIVHPVRAYIVNDGAAPIPQSAAKHPPSSKRRGITAAIIAAALALLAGVYFQNRQEREVSTPDQSGPPLVAVLPFANLSGDSKYDYFSDGVTLDIIAALGRFSNLSVLASGATAKFKGSTADSTALRQELGARYVVTGSVRRSGDRVRVTADLTDTSQSIHLWSQQFDGMINDIFSVQDEITREIVGALAIKLSRIEQDRAYAKRTDRPNAYDYFLRGRALLPTSDRSKNLEARALFESSIVTDPRYAAAYAWLGQTYLTEATAGWTEFAASALNRAEDLGRQALSISSDLAEGHQLLANVEQARGRYDRAIIEARRAIEINPSDAYGYATLGYALMWTGDAEGAIAAVERARLIDPTLQWDSVFSLGFAYYLAGRHEEAIGVLEPIAKLGSDFGIYAILAASYAELGRASDAKRSAAEAKRLWPFFKIDDFVQQWRDEKSRALIAKGLRDAGLD